MEAVSRVLSGIDGDVVAGLEVASKNVSGHTVSRCHTSESS